MAYRNAIISALALYHANESLFQYFALPEGLDKQTCIDTILIETADMSVVYTNPNKLMEMIGIWTNKNFQVWQKLYDSTQFDYNPIWNYDRHEEGTDNYDDKFNHTQNYNKTSKTTEDYERNLNEKTKFNSTGNNSYEDETNNEVSAFNEGLTPKEKTNQSGSGNNTVNNDNNIDQTGTTNNTINNTDTINDTVGNTTDHNSEHTLRGWGNIGVTTTQQMITQEREVVQFNVIDYIVNDFKKTFCIMVY